MSASSTSDSSHRHWLDVVRNQVSSLRFGFVQIVVHEGKIVQIEKTEKIRPPDFTPEIPSNAYPSPGGKPAKPPYY
jgi:hypothetical protein